VIASSGEDAANAIETAGIPFDDSLDVDRIGTLHGYSGYVPCVVCYGAA
jgi:hypothetical protein